MTRGLAVGLLTAAATLLVAGGLHAMQSKRAPCPDGVFLTDGTPFTTAEGGALAGVITLEAGEIRVDNVCETAVAARVRAKRRFDKVKGRWDSCAPFPSKVKLKAKLDAESCQTLEGLLGVKQVKPRKQPFSATRLSGAALALIEALGAEAVEDRMLDENFPFVMHPAAEYLNPELVDLIALGPEAVPATIAEFRRAADLGNETRLSLLAVALERLGDRRAVPALADWLETNLFTANLVWAPHLATHALKVLDGQKGLDTEQFDYDVDEMLDAVALARLGASRSPLSRARSRVADEARDVRPRAPPPDSNICHMKILVTGLNELEQSEEWLTWYTLSDKDIQQLVADEPAGGTRDDLTDKLEDWRAADETRYGTSDYVPIDPQGDVSLRSNCGGTVVERMLNEVARINGFPLRLGRGTTSADNARDLALKFGEPIVFSDLEPLLSMVYHEDSKGNSAHVEIPTHELGPGELAVFSKDQQGLDRQHVVAADTLVNWQWVVDRYNFKPFAANSALSTRFARIDPTRITDIRVDTSACPCRFRTGIDVDLVEPAEGEVDSRTVSLVGTASGAPNTTGNLRLNGKSLDPIDVVNDAFSTEIDLRSGENELKLSFEAPDGRRGCVERKVTVPCEFTDPSDPFNGGGVVLLSSDGGPVIEWPGYSAISIRSSAGAVVWFGAPPFNEPHILFELYGSSAVRPGTFEVRERPLSDVAFQRDFAVGRIREHAGGPGQFQKDDLVDGTLTVEEFQKGKQRLLLGHFDVIARSAQDQTTRRIVGRFDLCRFGIEKSNGISLAKLP